MFIIIFGKNKSQNTCYSKEELNNFEAKFILLEYEKDQFCLVIGIDFKYHVDILEHFKKEVKTETYIIHGGGIVIYSDENSTLILLDKSGDYGNYSIRITENMYEMLKNVFHVKHVIDRNNNKH